MAHLTGSEAHSDLRQMENVRIFRLIMFVREERKKKRK